MNTTLRNLLGFTLLLAVVLAMACQCFGTVTTDANGWTVVAYPPSGGGVMYFVDQDGGNNTWNGRSPFRYNFSGATYTHSTRRLVATGAFTSYTHTGGDYTDVLNLTGIGQVIIESKVDNDTVVIAPTSLLTGDLGSVASDSGPEATAAAGMGHLATGTDDQLLFQRGDTWTDEIIGANIESGISADEPILIGAYGSGARPRFLTATNTTFVDNVTTLNYIAFIGIEATPNDRQTDEAPDGLRIVCPGSDIIVEDCYLHDYATNLIVQASSGNYIENVKIRRNVISEAWSALDHSQGFYTTRIGNLLFEENIFDHNGWRTDWQDYAEESTGTTAAYTNGDTLTITTLQYGEATGAYGNELNVRLVDTNDASGNVSSVTFIDYLVSGGPRVTVNLDLTTGVASNVVAAAIQAYDSGNTFTCTSSGTADLVAADAGTQADVTSGGLSANPTIYNHHIYISEGGELNRTNGITITGNVFHRASNHAVKLEAVEGIVDASDNLMVANGVGGQWGMGSGATATTVNGIDMRIYNNVWTEGEAIANNNNLGPEIQNVAQGYFRNNILANRDPADGSGGSWQFLVNDHVDGVGINNFDIHDNVFYNLRGPFQFLDPEPAIEEANDTTIGGNTFEGNKVVLPTGETDAAPLVETDWADSGEMTYSGNTYYSVNSTSNGWFEVEDAAISTTTWQSTYEANATFTEPSFTAATRTASTFAVAEGYADRDAWIADLLTQRNGDWDNSIMAAEVNDYIRAGFDMSEYTPSSSKRVLILQ